MHPTPQTLGRGGEEGSSSLSKVTIPRYGTELEA